MSEKTRTEQMIENAPVQKREELQKIIDEATASGVMSCSKCGLLSGVFRITLSNAVNPEGEKVKICQFCKAEIMRNAKAKP